jgi:hypothetical protein
VTRFCKYADIADISYHDHHSHHILDEIHRSKVHTNKKHWVNALAHEDLSKLESKKFEPASIDSYRFRINAEEELVLPHILTKDRFA